MSFLNKVLGSFLGNKSEKDIKKVMPLVNQINKEFDKLQNISNDDLRQKTAELRNLIFTRIEEDQKTQNQLKAKVENSEIDFSEKESIYKEIDKLEKSIKENIKTTLDEIMPVAFAIMKETAKRFKENDELVVTANDFDKKLSTKYENVKIEGDKAIYKCEWLAGGTMIKWDMVHYDVQLIGGIALHNGDIAEMATGEGKTLVATLPVFLNALPGRGVHLVTVNDYLAKRDSEWMGPLYQFHGLSVDCIDKYQPNSSERRIAYHSDITFGTNNEFGFDYLRDNMAHRPEELVQRPHNYAIVDEVDSVLVDEARTPLIISGPVGKTDDDKLFQEYKPKVVLLYNEQKKLITSYLTEAKRLLESKPDEAGKALLRAHKGLPKNRATIKFLSEQGNRMLMQKTENLFLQENAKKMPEITNELYFVIEEQSNSVELTEKGIDLITGNTDDPEFFIMPDVGEKIAEIEQSGMSDKEKLKLKDEMLTEHAIKSERIHTVNQLVKAYAMFEKDVEYVVMDSKVKIVDEQTGRIMEGRRYSDGLHQAIEAKENVKIEETTQTYATITLQNYFRMYEKLSGMTGTAETEAQELWDIYKLDVTVIPTNRPITRNDYDDLIYKTKREKYYAVIDEIQRLKAQNRAVLVGTTNVEVSEVIGKMLQMKGVKHQILNAKLHQKEADIVANAGQPGTVTIATNMAGRGTDIKLHPKVKEAGGLAIIGTERHESRRVDRQLRGRAGRQGDPGSSQFFVSTEDDLMRIFGSERIAKVMDFLKLKEGEVIQHKMISNSIEKAQKKVEENNYGVRKRLLEYDDVMNSQREVVYTRRKNALFGEKLDIEIANMLFSLSSSIVNKYYSESDYDGFSLEIMRTFSIEPPVSFDDFKAESSKIIIEKIQKLVFDSFKRRMDSIKEQLWPFVEKTFQEQSGQTEFISVLISDGTKIYRILSELKSAYNNQAQEILKDLEKTIMLVAIDEAWKEHLRELDDLKQAVHGASYEQKDPLLIYKMESFDLFDTMMNKANGEIVSSLMKAHIYIPEQAKRRGPQRQVSKDSTFDFKKLQTSKSDGTSSSSNQNITGGGQFKRTDKKVGRNDPCPCGSGKKYKSCHGKDDVN
ncbi:MAG: preprotein translocase subunit SecA [Bacteroidales bacterium]|nr:preprotein translocase subunit SecA [Bacteroidales bacterium]